MALQLGPKDLMDKQWTMQPLDPDGKIGHFYSSRGKMRSSLFVSTYSFFTYSVFEVWSYDMWCWFFSGEVYNVVKESVDRKKLYAMMPGSSQHSGNDSLLHFLTILLGHP